MFTRAVKQAIFRKGLSQKVKGCSPSFKVRLSPGLFPVSASCWLSTAFSGMQSCQPSCKESGFEQSFLWWKNSPQGLALCLGDLADGVMSTLECVTVKLSSVLIFFYLSILFRARSKIQKLAQRNARSNSPCIYWIPYLWSAYPAFTECWILTQIGNISCA